MRETSVTLPELGLVAGTRVALGAGIGLLLADLLTPEQRRAVGWTLLAFGAVTTVPLLMEILGKARVPAPEARLAEAGTRVAPDGGPIRHGLPEDRVGYPT